MTSTSLNIPPVASLGLLAVLMMGGCGTEEPVAPLAFPAAEEQTDFEAPFGTHRVFYRSVGQGPTLVLVHGWASTHEVWSAQLESSLTESVRLIAIDLPGHGHSDLPDDFTVNDFARSVAAVMAHAGVERAVLVGHSNGTPVIREVLRQFPERVAGLVVVDGPLRQTFDEVAAERFLERFRSNEYGQAVKQSVDQMISAGQLTVESKTAIAEMARSVGQPAIVGGIEAVADSEAWDDDPIDVPLLAVYAKQPTWTDEYEAFVRALAPGVEYVMWDDVSHFVMMERPDEFQQVLETFLATIGYVTTSKVALASPDSHVD